MVDIARAWSARFSDDDGWIDVGKAMDFVFVKDSAHKASRSISKFLKSISLQYDEIRSAAGNAFSFFTEKMKPGTGVKLLTAF